MRNSVLSERQMRRFPWYAGRRTRIIGSRTLILNRTGDAPEDTSERENGWKGFRVEGVLDFSLVGILSKLTAVLAENRIGIFAVSTFNTDYILVKAENFDRAAEALKAAGYEVM